MSANSYVSNEPEKQMGDGALATMWGHCQSVPVKMDALDEGYMYTMTDMSTVSRCANRLLHTAHWQLHGRLAEHGT